MSASAIFGVMRGALNPLSLSPLSTMCCARRWSYLLLLYQTMTGRPCRVCVCLPMGGVCLVIGGNRWSIVGCTTSQLYHTLTDGPCRVSCDSFVMGGANHCSIVGCTTGRRCKGLSFHKVPRKGGGLDEWRKQLLHMY